jgi:hypothetical protein
LIAGRAVLTIVMSTISRTSAMINVNSASVFCRADNWAPLPYCCAAISGLHAADFGRLLLFCVCRTNERGHWAETILRYAGGQSEGGLPDPTANISLLQFAIVAPERP